MTSCLPPGFICSAYFYAAAAGMVSVPQAPGDLEFLRELGLRAASLARWEGLPAVRVPEGPFTSPGVFLWPERIWSEVANQMANHAAEHGDYGDPQDVLPPGARSPGQVPPSAAIPRDDDFWSYPAPPDDTQAYADWCQMADEAERKLDGVYGFERHGVSGYEL